MILPQHLGRLVDEVEKEWRAVIAGKDVDFRDCNLREEGGDKVHVPVGPGANGTADVSSDTRLPESRMRRRRHSRFALLNHE